MRISWYHTCWYSSSTFVLTLGYSGKDAAIPLTPATFSGSAPSTVFMFLPPLIEASSHHLPFIHQIKVLLQLLAPAAVMVIQVCCHPCQLFLLYIFFPLLHQCCHVTDLISFCKAMKVGQVQGKFGDNFFQFRVIVADAPAISTVNHYSLSVSCVADFWDHPVHFEQHISYVVTYGHQ